MIIPVLFLPDAEQLIKLISKLAVGSIAQCKSVLPSFFACLKLQPNHLKNAFKMETKTLCCGIDVSFTTLDVCYQNNLGELFHLHVGNNHEGFKKNHGAHRYCSSFCDGSHRCVLIRLAFFLHSKGCSISVVNALSIKRFIQMHGERNKSDKKDAAWICRYAIEQRPPIWQMPDSAYFQGKQLYNTIREYQEQIKRFNNQLHSLGLLPVQSKDAMRSIEKMKDSLKKGSQEFGTKTTRAFAAMATRTAQKYQQRKRDW